MDFKSALKWAILLFFLTLIWMTFEKLMGWHGDNIHQHATYTLFYDLIFAGVFLVAFWQQKKRVEPGQFSFKKAFLFGFSITVLITLISPLTQTIINLVISPEFFPNIITYAVENGVLTQAQAEAQFNLQTYIIQNFIGTLILGSLFSVIFAAIFRHKQQTV